MLPKPDMNPDRDMNNQDALMRRHEERQVVDAPPMVKDREPSRARVAYQDGVGKQAKLFMEVPFLGYLVFAVNENPADPTGKLDTVGCAVVTVQESIFD